MNLRNKKSLAVIVILVLTAALFVWFLGNHPDYIDSLQAVDVRYVLLIQLANVCGMAVLVGLYQILVRMTGKRLGGKENTLLTIYSSVANFFGPLQSGPGVRAAYLKKRHSVSLRTYFFATLIYYAVFAVISGFCLLVGTSPWWMTLLGSLAVAVASAASIRYFSRRKSDGVKQLILSRTLLTWLVVLTAAQVLFVAVRYYFALQASNTDVSVGQALSYTGAANFALFVSITPDGIGIRETFLLFAQSIHGVPTESIVTANLIDRASYVTFLGLLFLVAASMHASQRLQLSGIRSKR